MPYATAETKLLTVWVPCVRSDDPAQGFAILQPAAMESPMFARRTISISGPASA